MTRLRVHRPDSDLRPIRLVVVDDIRMAVSQGSMPMRVAVRLRAFPTLVWMLVMLVMCVQVLVLRGPVLVLEDSGIGGRP